MKYQMTAMHPFKGRQAPEWYLGLAAIKPPIIDP
jgi:hypothetical protein